MHQLWLKEISAQQTLTLYDWGLAVTIEQVLHPGENVEDEDNGLLDWNVIWEDPSREWLTAVEDIDVTTANSYGVYDWIRSGTQGAREQAAYGDPSWHDYANQGEPLDPAEAYERIWPGPNGGGRVAPYRLTSNECSSECTGKISTSCAANGIQCSSKQCNWP